MVDEEWRLVGRCSMCLAGVTGSEAVGGGRAVYARQLHCGAVQPQGERGMPPRPLLLLPLPPSQEKTTEILPNRSREQQENEDLI